MNRKTERKTTYKRKRESAENMTTNERLRARENKDNSEYRENTE